MNTVSATTAKTSHRKLIDIPEDVVRALTVKAAAMGYHLVSTRPEGQVMVSESEKDIYRSHNPDICKIP